MVLGWTEPANNGGAAIRGYFVDYRTVKGSVVGKWHEMNHQALTTTTYKVSSFTKFKMTFSFHELKIIRIQCQLALTFWSYCHVQYVFCVFVSPPQGFKSFLIICNCFSLGWEPEGERLLRVPGARHEHGRCEQILFAQCTSGVQGVDHYCARYRKTLDR